MFLRIIDSTLSELINLTKLELIGATFKVVAVGGKIIPLFINTLEESLCL